MSSNYDAVNKISGCEFRENSGKGLMRIIDSILNIENSIFDGNVSVESPSIKTL